MIWVSGSSASGSEDSLPRLSVSLACVSAATMACQACLKRAACNWGLSSPGQRFSTLVSTSAAV
eukprot:492178-Amphidinium_carterae.1